MLDIRNIGCPFLYKSAIRNLKSAIDWPYTRIINPYIILYRPVHKNIHSHFKYPAQETLQNGLLRHSPRQHPDKIMNNHPYLFMIY
jgi:hypothetical protein